MSKTTYPKSKRRKMRAFKLEEISLVDKPAQQGAVAVLMKRAASDKIMKRLGEMCVQEEEEMTEYELLQKQMRAIDSKLDAILKAGPTDLRGVERATPYQVDQNGEGPEFEKEPEDYEDEYEVDEEDEDEVDKGGVPYQGKPRRGDWPPGSDDPAPGDGPPDGTRGDDYVSGDESHERKRPQMTPERASQVLQPYADGGEEDEDEEELEEGVHKLADRLAKMHPRATNGALQKTLEGALHARASFNPRFGREREYIKRAQAQAISEAQRQYSKVSIRKANGTEYRVRGPLSYSEAVEIAKQQYPDLF
jgi:hypothetical protein